LYVAPGQRGMGLGRRLLAAVEAYARTRQAHYLWLETSNLNFPAIQFYRRVGFQLCGLDQTLYAPDSDAAGETALYFAKALG
jgi:ribosomal protein S18 acetylase RimI-like enzyme